MSCYARTAAQNNVNGTDKERPRSRRGYLVRSDSESLPQSVCRHAALQNGHRPCNRDRDEAEADDETGMRVELALRYWLKVTMLAARI